LADDVTLVWSPTPRSVEQAPLGNASIPTERAPNGLLLGLNPGQQLAHAVSAGSTETFPLNAEIGVEKIKKDRIQKTIESLAKNPPIPVDLARITRVFSTKLQFAEFTVKGAKFSKRELRVSNDYINADVRGELKGLVESKLRAFGEFRNEEAEVPAFNHGEEVFDRNQKRLMEKVSEASLQRQRNELERRYLYNLPGFGRLIAKDEKPEFERLVAAFGIHLEEYSRAIRERLEVQTGKVIDEAVALIVDRASRTDTEMNHIRLKQEFQKNLARAQDEEPEVRVVFKDVTYEQTKNPDFRAKVDKALPALKRRQLGDWSSDFDAAKEAVRS
jgi:hypothetical protein